MVQNHLMLLLTLVAMEPPAALEADTLRDEKVKVLRSIRPISPELIAAHVVRGQYGPGSADGEQMAGYRSEAGVAKESNTETYVAAKLFISTCRRHAGAFDLPT